MAGDATNVRMWQQADVYIGPIGATEPTDVSAAWDADWDLVGLLDGEEGFTETREEETTEKFAWGSLLVKTTKSKHKRAVRFVALEDNDTVFALVNPGSTRTENGGITTSEFYVPQFEEFAIGFETREGDTVRRKWAARAELAQSPGSIVDKEAEVTVYECVVTIYPDDDGLLFTELSGTVAAGS